MTRILIVDDEAPIANQLARLFSENHFEAVAAYDRAAAEQLLESGTFAIVLADLRLGTQEEGLALIDAVHAMGPATRLVTLTGYATPEMESEVSRRGSSFIVQKPFDDEELVRRISELVASIETLAGTTVAEESLDTLYEDLRKVLYSIPLRRYHLPKEEAEDIVQQAWLLFLEKRSEVKSPGPWLAGTVSNLCRQNIQKVLRGRTVPLGDDECDVADIERDGIDDIAVRQMLDGCDAKTRTLFQLIAIEGLSYQETGERMNLPLGSIGPTYLRAKQKMRQMFA